MTNFQIRDMPQELYQRIANNARREHRSLAQQAVIELRRALELNTSGTSRRAAVLEQLRAEPRRLADSLPAPEDLVREDRDR